MLTGAVFPDARLPLLPLERLVLGLPHWTCDRRLKQSLRKDGAKIAVVMGLHAEECCSLQRGRCSSAVSESKHVSKFEHAHFGF